MMGWRLFYDRMDDAERLEMLQAMLFRHARPSVRLQPRHVALPAVLAQAILFLLLRSPILFTISNIIIVAIVISPSVRPRRLYAHWVN
jgi:hypothetical protein